VEEGNENWTPTAFALDQNYPNPFNPTTTLRYALPKDARVNITIYNILGLQIATLRDEVQSMGSHDIVWNGRNDFGAAVASGTYFYRIDARPADGSPAFTNIKKMVLLK
jgi:flagellar hook assembly protein FlgD